MAHQATRTGEIVEGPDPAHPTVEERREILRRALGAWEWAAAVEAHPPQGRFVKFSAHTEKAGKAFDLQIYIFPNLANSARNRDDEMRIQLTRPYQEHQADFELDKQGLRRCLLLGIYRLSPDDIVICAWDAAAYRGHANPNSCYVDIRAIAGAFRSGFDRSQDNKGRYVCCFRPEFLHYYIENMAHLHIVEVGAEQQIAPEVNGQMEIAEAARVRGGANIIYYGAPGTGKSHTVDMQIQGRTSVRTVFHPDMQNSDFVGALKPVTQDGRVSYAFSPGPFAMALRNALRHPDRETYLVIEELNRAPAAAVFGDLFLLLDRTADGSGKYDVDFPTLEFRAWLCDELGREINKVYLPSNLWLLATMNSADQGVYPIDTAFRRRWKQVYVPIDYVQAPAVSVTFVGADGVSARVEWGTFARQLNQHLINRLSIAEDRLLGPWFVAGEDVARDEMPSKVLLYLWDDLLRHHGRDQVFDLRQARTFGEVTRRVQAGERIFAEEFLNLLAPVATPVEA